MSKKAKAIIVFPCLLLCLFFCTGFNVFADTDTEISNTLSTGTTQENSQESIRLPSVYSSEVEIPTPVGEGLKEPLSLQKTWATVTAWVFIIIAVVLIISVVLSISNSKAHKRDSFNRKSYSRQRMKYKRHKISNRYNSKK